jgi:hypothetical protein
MFSLGFTSNIVPEKFVNEITEIYFAKNFRLDFDRNLQNMKKVSECSNYFAEKLYIFSNFSLPHQNTNEGEFFFCPTKAEAAKAAIAQVLNLYSSELA